MIPQTVLGFFFFLLLVAPGVSYQLLRERRDPQIRETAFREAARVALYSFWFSFLASAIIILLRILFPTSLGDFVIDPGAYAHNTQDYINSHYKAIVSTVVLEVLIAFALVIAVDQISSAKLYAKFCARLPGPIEKIFKSISTGGRTYEITSHGLWWDMFLTISKKEIAWLSIRLTDGSRVSGFFHMCTSYDRYENAEIAIKKGKVDDGGSMLVLDKQDLNKQDGDKPQELHDEDLIWVRGDDISYIKVTYLPIYSPPNTNTQPGK